MNRNFEGYHVDEITLYTNDDFKPGMAVMIAENCTAVISNEGSNFIGVCTGVRGNYISVALTGAVTVPYSGVDFSVGYNLISPDSNGYLRLDFEGTKEYLILDIDKDEKLMTIWL